jgi:hypothetical protein
MKHDYDLQLAMMEKRVMEKSNPLTVNEIRNCLRLSDQFKRKCRNCGVVWHKVKVCKTKFHQSGGNHNNFQKNTSNGAYCTYCC